MFGSLVAVVLGCAAPPEVPPRPAAPEADTAVDTAPTSFAPHSVLRDRDGPARHVVMLSIDTLRRDAVTPASAPFLTGLAARGLSLERHRSCSNWTVASMMCALSGRSTVDLGFHPMTLDPLPDALEFLPDLLRDRGYAGRMVTGNELLVAENRLTDGYDEVVLAKSQPASVIVDRGLELLDGLRSGDAPWVLHLHFMDPHAPYDPPDAR